PSPVIGELSVRGEVDVQRPAARLESLQYREAPHVRQEVDLARGEIEQLAVILSHGCVVGEIAEVVEGVPAGEQILHVEWQLRVPGHVPVVVEPEDERSIRSELEWMGRKNAVVVRVEDGAAGSASSLEAGGHN